MITNRSFAILAAFVALCTVSCKKGETVIDIFESNGEYALAPNDSAGVSITQSIEYLTTFERGRTLCSKVNNQIVKFCFGDRYDGVPLPEASAGYIESLVTDYRKDAGESYDPESDSWWMYNWYYNLSGRFAESYGDLQTYTVYSENFLGGAHGMQSMIPHVIDLRTGEEVEEESLFLEGYEEPVAELIRKALQEAWGSPDDPGSTYCMMEEDGMVPNGYFGVSEEGMTWYYQPYVIASYAQGIIEAKVGWNSLKPYIDKEVLKP